MLKRVILGIAAVAAGPLAVTAQPAVANAAECVIASVSDSVKDGVMVTRTFNSSKIGAAIQNSFGQTRFITEGNTLHSMQGVVYCQGGAPFFNPFSSWTTQNSAGPAVTVTCPSGFTGTGATAYLRETKSSCSSVPGPD